MRTLLELLNDWRQARQEMDKLVNERFPRIVGNEAVRVVKQNFNLHGYDDGMGLKAWKERLEVTNRAYTRGRGKGGKSQYKGSVFSASKPLLKQTLNLYNNIKYIVSNGTVLIGVDMGLVPYAQRHNEGLDKMPKRQFMPLPNQPPNKKMLIGFEKKFNFERDRILKTFK